MIHSLFWSGFFDVLISSCDSHWSFPSRLSFLRSVWWPTLPAATVWTSRRSATATKLTSKALLISKPTGWDYLAWKQRGLYCSSRRSWLQCSAVQCLRVLCMWWIHKADPWGGACHTHWCLAPPVLLGCVFQVFQTGFRADPEARLQHGEERRPPEHRDRSAVRRRPQRQLPALRLQLLWQALGGKQPIRGSMSSILFSFIHFYIYIYSILYKKTILSILPLTMDIVWGCFTGP